MEVNPEQVDWQGSLAKFNYENEGHRVEPHHRINPDSRSTRTDLIAATDFSGVGFNDLFCRSLMSLIVWFLLTVHFSRGILVV